MKSFLTLTMTLFTAGASFAGGPDAPQIEPTVAASTSSSNWTGFYAGGQIAYLNGDLGNSPGDLLEFSGTAYGLHAGYNYDLGQFVVGGELEYDAGDVRVDVLGGVDTGINIDSILRLKARGGYDLGRTLVYGTVGFAQARTSVDTGLEPPPGKADGYFGGVGVAFMPSDHFIVGGEILRHEFDGFENDPTTDPSATTVSLRLSYKF
jgi:outer membrane immunogenic protein